MRTRMKSLPHIPRALLALAFSALILTGCSGGLASTSWPGISADETSVYLAFSQAVRAIDLKDGHEQWFYPREADRSLTMFAPPALAPEDQIIVGAYNMKVLALQKEDQTVAWESDASKGRIVGAPVIAGDFVLVPSADGNLYALDVRNGSLAWSFKARQALWASPAVEGDAIYLTSLDHHVYALDLSSGKSLWQTDLGGAIPDKPAIAGDVILAGTLGDKLFALQKQSGEILWQIEAKNWVWGTPAVADGVAYVADLSGVASAVSTANGAEVWSRTLGGRIIASPLLADKMVYFVTEAGAVYALSAADGKTVWQKTPGGKLLSDPVLAGKTLVVSALGGESLLSAYDAQSGELLWSYKPAEQQG